MPTMITSGDIVGERYRVVRVLGGGGMKQVYLAEDLRLSSRPCALAEMVDGFTSADAQRQAIVAFQREADMLAQLSNEHIPRVIDRFSEANRHYLVMEYIDGITLEERLKQSSGKTAAPEIVAIAIQILETLEYLHNLTPPVIYRDLKPSNVMITPAGLAKLIDFGIARHFAPLSNATMIGTQGYAPPEQYRGKVDARSDLYALGATMHQALSGRDPAAEPPFSFPPLRKICPDIDPALATVVDQALAYDVVSRIHDASEFKRRLLALREGALKPSPAPGASATPQAAQMQLPLGSAGTWTTGPADELAVGNASPSSAEAATVVIANAEIICCAPDCARPIPADSHYCSFCGVVQRRPSTSGARPNAPTVILSPASRSESAEEVRGDPARRRNPARRRQRRRGTPNLIRVLIVVVLVGFFATKAILRATWNDAPQPDSNADAPDVGPLPPELSVVQQARLYALRQALDATQLGTVQFYMDHDELVLSGTIPSETTRDTVYGMCRAIAGISKLRDNLQVAEPGATG
jgi:serine/threonine protein kinase